MRKPKIIETKGLAADQLLEALHKKKTFNFTIDRGVVGYSTIIVDTATDTDYSHGAPVANLKKSLVLAIKAYNDGLADAAAHD